MWKHVWYQRKTDEGPGLQNCLARVRVAEHQQGSVECFESPYYVPMPLMFDVFRTHDARMKGIRKQLTTDGIILVLCNWYYVEFCSTVVIAFCRCAS